MALFGRSKWGVQLIRVMKQKSLQRLALLGGGQLFPKGVVSSCIRIEVIRWW